MREKEKLANMELALANINDKLLEMSELASISTALLEAATMPSEDALRTIVRALAFRLEYLDDVRDEIERTAHDGLREPEAEEESEAAREKPGSGGA